jgi:hypothetical protein
MKFRIKINAVVEADSIDDAFEKCENHFRYLQDTEVEDPQTFSEGGLEIYPDGDESA